MIKKVLLVFLFLIFYSAGVFAEEGKIFLAVLDLEIVGEIPRDLEIPLSESLREGLFQTGKFRVIDRNNMDRLLKEQGFQISDCTSSECAVQVGRLLGVQKMVTGSLSRVGTIYVISAQLINVETGEIEMIASDRCPCETDELLPSVDRVAEKLSVIKPEEEAAPPEEEAPAAASEIKTEEKTGASSSPPRPKSLWVAGVLSIIPGLGQIYNGQVWKGLIFFGAFATCTTLGSAQAKETGERGIWGGLGGIVWAANEADAVWSAHRINRAAERNAEKQAKFLIYNNKIMANLIFPGGTNIE